MTSILEDRVALETKASDIPGSGILTGDQTALLSGIHTSLHGLGYPAKKNDILKQAKKNGADITVLNAIKAVPERHYASPEEILQEFGERQ